MSTKKKLPLTFLLLLALPGAALELINNIYNVYVPIYLQAGGEGFSKTTLTLGFGVTAMLVGFWLTADNIFSFFVQPFIGAWSDRVRTKLGRRMPFILGTLPLVIIGVVLIPLIPTLIPPERSGQQSELVSLFVLFTLCCVVYYLGASPARVILQALRQESVPPEHRAKVESWYFFLLNAGTIVAYTAGGKLYELYGPLIFWAALGLYLVTVVLLLVFFREPKDLAEAAGTQESGNIKQLGSIFRNASAETRRNLLFFLGSVVMFAMVLSTVINFGASWAVQTLAVSETTAASILSFVTIAAVIVALPFGYLAGTKFGRRNTYVVSLAIALLGLLVLVFLPKVYLVGFAIFGIGMSGTLTSQLPLASEIAYDQSRLGATIGIYNLAYMFGFLMGANVAGVVIDATSYNFLFVSAAVFMAVGLLLALFIRATKPAAVTG